jgi:hypothetical protein
MNFLSPPVQVTNEPKSLDHPDECAGCLILGGFGQDGPVSARIPETPRERRLAGFDYIED